VRTLAAITGTAPFFGLLGTVFGILGSFMGTTGSREHAFARLAFSLASALWFVPFGLATALLARACFAAVRGAHTRMLEEELIAVHHLRVALAHWRARL